MYVYMHSSHRYRSSYLIGRRRHRFRRCHVHLAIGVVVSVVVVLVRRRCSHRFLCRPFFFSNTVPFFPMDNHLRCRDGELRCRGAITRCCGECR